ncbi:hypothetical protein BN381_50183 [Candidatus Microthrix parvicella RN1]|uniref:Uncharacterized protein n=1 Tax=Candidatus Neomicrothrix parvicella RN1 TaxID=1229780 RepID=R4Z659_9ACTN|nr:hypothetical protein BN381_50183 [Candidatus Microthrix parvicella RN1]
MAAVGAGGVPFAVRGSLDPEALLLPAVVFAALCRIRDYAEQWCGCVGGRGVWVVVFGIILGF